MKGFSVSRLLRTTADAMDNHSIAPLSYFRHRWRLTNGWVLATNDQFIYENAQGEIYSAEAPGTQRIEYNEWKQRNSNDAHNRFRRYVTLAGGAIGVAFAIHQNAKSRNSKIKYYDRDDDSYYDYENTCPDCDAIFGSIVAGSIGAVAGYFAHFTLPIFVLGGGVILTSRVLGRFYKRKE